VLLAAGVASRLAWAQQVPAPQSAADVPGTPPGTITPKDYVAMVAASGISRGRCNRLTVRRRSRW
jgi:hypothetical protein